MITVSIKDEYRELLTALGELQDAIDLALQRYTIEPITAQVEELRRDHLRITYLIEGGKPWSWVTPWPDTWLT